MTALEPPTLRPQVPDDASAVQHVLRESFTDEPEVMGLEAALSRRSDSRGFVAELDGRIVGHVRVTRGWIDAAERLVTVLVLGPLAVEPGSQRRGIGRALVTVAVVEAERQGTPALFLEGDPGYYGRLGWIPAAALGVTAPSDRIPAAACQAVALRGYEPWMRGRLVYADAFWECDCVGLRGSALQQAREALGE